MPDAYDLLPPRSMRAIWLAEQVAAGPGYGVHFELRCERRIEPEAVRRALDAMSARHEALRIRWHLVGGELRMRANAQPLPLELVDLTHSPPADQDRAMAVRIRAAEARRADLAHDPPLRTTLVDLGPRGSWLLLDSHHITVDGASLMILARELVLLVEDQALPPLGGSFAEHAVAEAAWLEDHGPTEREWWARQLRDWPTPSHPARSPRRGHLARLNLEPATTAALHALARQQGCTPYRALFASFAGMLALRGSGPELALGVFHGGRDLPGSKGLLGTFVNIVPVRIAVGAAPTLRALLDASQQAVGLALAHGRLPHPELRALSPDPGQPLVRVIIGAQLAPEGLDLPAGWRLHLRSLDCAPHDSARFELKVKSARLPSGGLWVELEVDADRFEPGRAEQMLDELRELIEQGLADPDRPLVRRAPAIPPLLHQLEAQVRRDPHAIAVIAGDRTLSYGELWGRAMAVAHSLRAQGAGPDQVVGLLCGRGPPLLVGIWGILASGAAWIPVDPSLPPARREVMLADAGARLVLTEADLWPDPSDQPLPPQPGPQALAYVLSTSGSTGRPKGVEIERGAIEHLLAELAWIWRPRPGGQVAATTNASFDISMVELLFPLLHGASIRLFDAREIRDPQVMAAALDEVDLIQATPTYFSLLLRAGWRPLPTQTIFSAGEALPLDLARTLSAQAPLWNLYGPTEATVFATVWKVPALPEAIRIGRALPGYRTLLDPQGELLIGGIGLARGYRGQPELSAERFIDGTPFGLPGERLYRSGDLCRLDETGEIEHLGRLDDQVKIRGNRVELGEIEAALRALPGIQQAVAAPWRDEELGDRVLAWYQPGPQDPGEEALREALSRTLPEYMVPSRLLAVAEIPRTQAGKADRKALPRPGAVQASRDSGLVARIAAVMAAVIGRPEIDPRRGFFELGGSSIQLVVCAQRLGVELGRPVRVAELFDHPSAERLAASLSARQETLPPARSLSVEPLASDPRASETLASEPLAIVGLSCRLPGGVHSAEQLRRLLWEGVDAIGPVPPGRWDTDALGPEGSGLLPTRLGGFVHDILRFDAAAFGLSPREAAAMDPQHRLALELAFEAIENAAIRPDELAGQQVGVFLGLCGTDYQGRAVWRPHLQDIDPLSATGSVHSTAAGRIAHQLDLRGPAMVVDTACSSSLVAAHLAAASLRRGECELALVGGVNVVLSPRWGVAFSALGLLSPSGRCQAFGAGADGYVRAEGGGFLLLAPLSVAQRRGWPVAALLRGSAINHDGRAASLTAPNGLAQRAVIAAALRDAGIDAHQLQAVEAHGTGTELGDPIEVGALAAALHRDDPQAPPLHLGSIKSNLGHLEGAAGISGLLKAVLAVQASTLPPTLHASPGNRHIPWTEQAIRPLVEATPWPEGTRRIGVGSFGFSGTNAWAVVEQAPPRPPLVPAAGPRLLRLSARSDSALNALAQRLLEHLDAERPDLASFCWTLARARQPRAVVASGLVADLDQARALLREIASGQRPSVTANDPAPASLLALPTEPFEGSLLSLPEPLAEDGRRLDHPLLQRQVALAEGLFLFEGRLDLALLPELRDHRVDGQAIFPAVCTWEALRRAGEALLGQPEIELGELSLLQPLVLPEQGAVRLQILLRPQPDGRFQASMSARREQGQEAWTLHARATVGVGSFAQGQPLAVLEDGAAAAARFYDSLDAVGVDYGPAFRGLVGLQMDGRSAHASLSLPPSVQGSWRGAAHPVLLDAALQAVGALLLEHSPTRMLPAGAERILLAPGRIDRAELRLAESEGEVGGEQVRASLRACDDQGRELLRVEGLLLRAAPSRGPVEQDLAWIRRWEEVKPSAEPPEGPVQVFVEEDALREVLVEVPGIVLWPGADGLAFAQHLLSLPVPLPSLWITRGAADVGEGPMHPDGALLSGLVRVLRAEGAAARWLDLDPDDQALEPILAALGSREPELACRGGRFFAPRTVPTALPALPFVPTGRWLITGGLGGLGLRLAAALAQQPGVEEILLLSRRAPQEPLPASRVPMRTLAVDVCDEGALREALAPLGPIHGLIHAAGVLEDATIPRATAEQMARVLAPKREGALALHGALAGQPLQHFILFSSISGWLGPAGQAAYAAANTWLDAFAAWRRRQGLPAISLAWGPWSEVGMAARARPEDRQRAARQGLHPLSPDEAIGLLGRAASASQASIGLARMQRPSLARAPASPRPRASQDLQAVLREELARSLGLDPDGPTDWSRSFQELGVDSLLAVELRDRLGSRLGLSLPATLVFDHPSLAAVQRLVTERLSEAGPEPVEEDAPRLAPEEPIAIIGMACRLPGGVHGPEELRSFLLAGGDAIAEVPSDRWDARAWFHPDPDTAGRTNTLNGGFIQGFEQFDAGFFGLSEREAMASDPQQRLLLEVSFEALEDAGQRLEQLRGQRGGVWVGLMTHDSYVLNGRHLDRMDGHFHTGHSGAITSGRLSYFYGLTGPSMTIDTACSSGLVSSHLAATALRQGECELALVAGVSLVQSPGVNVEFSSLHGMSADGRCRAFDAGASGVGWSEGCAVLVLKRLSDAVRDGDRVHGLLRGSAVNQDGRSNGLTAPNGPSQEEVIRRALAAARLAPAQIDYVEAHGTGTSLGDPIEAGALGRAFRKDRPADRPLRFGSVKANLGHTQAPSGLVGTIKVLLAMRHQQLLPQIHFHTPSPHIPWAELPLSVVDRPAPWPRGAQPRRAGVSSFGISGTNVHLVIEEGPPAPSPAAEAGGPYLLPLSARDPQALRERARQVSELLKSGRHALPDLLWTLACRRSAMEQRLCVLGQDAPELAAALDGWLADPTGSQAVQGQVVQGQAVGTAPAVAFVFAGQGAHHPGMLRALVESSPDYRAAFEPLDAEVQRQLGWSPLAMLQDPDPERWSRSDRLQPLRLCTDVALAELWRRWGVQPAMVLGHSQGEAAAALFAGALDLPDAVRVIGLRSALMERVREQGAMLAVELSAEQAQAQLDGRDPRISVAVVNGPRACVVGGPRAALVELNQALEAQGVWSRFVRDGAVSHGPMVDSLREELLDGLSALRPRPSALPLHVPPGSEAGSPLPVPALDAKHFWTGMRQPVRFDRLVAALAVRRDLLFLECGPQEVLGAAIDEQAPGRALGSLRRGEPELICMLRSAARLWCRGVPLRWEQIQPAGRTIDLPRYPWQHRTYRLDWGRLQTPADLPGAARLRAAVHAAVHPLLGEPFSPGRGGGQHWWRSRLSARSLPWLADHQVGGAILLPGMAWVEAARAAASLALGRPLSPVGLRFHEALVLGEQARELEFELDEDLRGASFHARSRAPGGRWILHAQGRLEPAELAIEPWMEAGEEADVASLYEWMEARRLRYGPAFRGLETLRFEPGTAQGEIRRPKALVEEDARWGAHPVLLDIALHLVAAASPREAAAGPVVPVGLDAMVLPTLPLPERFRARARWMAGEEPGSASGEVELFALDGTPLGALRGLRLKAVEAPVVAAVAAAEQPWLLSRWIPAPTMEAQGRALRVGLWGPPSGPSGHLPPHAGGPEGNVNLPPLAGGGAEHSEAEGGRRTADIALLTRLLTAAGHSVVELHTAPWDFASLDHLLLLPPPPSDDPVGACTQALIDTLHLAQGLEAAGLREPPRVWRLTRGAMEADGCPVDPAQTALLGQARSLANELTAWRLVRLDLDPGRSLTAQGAELLALLGSDPVEDELALRAGGTLVPRLVRELPGAGRGRVQRASGPVRVECLARGSFDGFQLSAVRSRPPGTGEVRVELRAIGLNFLDVLNALSAVDLGTMRPGLEAAGVVLEVGLGVEGLQPGQAVIAMGDGLMGTEATLPASWVFAMPAGLDFAQAASLSVAHATVWQSLVPIARLERGERLLVHAGTGGVGLAAIQWARRLGAQVFATAGSEEKRALLRSMGVAHVSDSRSARFVEDVLAWTDGEGVDVVLNSLSGELLARGLDVLRPFGRFIELGKRDVLADGKLGLRPFLRNLSFSLVDLNGMALRALPRFRRAVQTALDAVAEGGEVGPLPLRRLPLSRWREGLETMARASHIGRLVLEPDPERIRVRQPTDAPLPRDGTWLVSGGLGGLGLSLAEDLSRRGLGALLLLGRSGVQAGVQGEAQRQAIARMSARGTQVEVLAVDVADGLALEAALDEARTRLPPLRGVVHAAGVLEDGLINRQDADRYRKVLAPKIAGAWNLHRLTLDDPLDAFVLYGSASGTMGAPGQSAYAAGNTFLEGLAWARHQQGRPALCLAWGAFSEVGLAAAQGNRGDRIASGGVRSISPDEGLSHLWAALASEAVSVGVLPASLRQWIELMPQAAASPRVAAGAGQSTITQDDELRSRVRAARPEQRAAIVLAFVRQQLGTVLRTRPGSVDPARPLSDLGVDSLMGLELRNRLEAGLGERLESTLIWTHPTAEALAENLLGRLVAGEVDAPVEASPVLPSPAALPVDQLDDDELDAHFDDRLADLESRFS